MCLTFYTMRCYATTVYAVVVSLVCMCVCVSVCEEGHEERFLLFNALFLQLPCRENHVDCTSRWSEAALRFG